MKVGDTVLCVIRPFENSTIKVGDYAVILENPNYTEPEESCVQFYLANKYILQLCHKRNKKKLTKKYCCFREVDKDCYVIDGEEISLERMIDIVTEGIKNTQREGPSIENEAGNGQYFV